MRSLSFLLTLLTYPTYLLTHLGEREICAHAPRPQCERRTIRGVGLRVRQGQVRPGKARQGKARQGKVRRIQVDP